MQIRCGNQAVNANILQVRLTATGLFKPDWMGLYFYIAGWKRCARVRGPVETAMAVIRVGLWRPAKPKTHLPG